MYNIIFVSLILGIIGLVINRSLVNIIITFKIIFLSFLLLMIENNTEQISTIVYLVSLVVIIYLVSFLSRGRESNEDIDRL